MSDKLDKLQQLVEKKRKEQEDALEREKEERRAKIARSDELWEGENERYSEAAVNSQAEENKNDVNYDEEGKRPTVEELFGADDEEEDIGEGNQGGDDGFIDDTGVAPENRVDFNDEEEEEEGLTFDEAEEAVEEELDRLFGKRTRYEEGNEAENRAMVEGLITQMEVAVEEDMVAFEKKKPAVHKLRMLERVEDIVSMKKLHNELLDSGLLGVLKAWIDLMPDGTLPNSRIRSAVLSMLLRLPVDCTQEDRREQLKRSELGRVVMFYSKIPEETAENRRMARELVERWSRPILTPQGPSVDEVEMERILEARRLRQRNLESSAGQDLDEDEDIARQLRPGDPGYRRNARIPQAAALDYVKRPESRVVMPTSRVSGKSSEHKLTKKLKKLGKKTSLRAANVSVEGRNLGVTR